MKHTFAFLFGLSVIWPLQEAAGSLPTSTMRLDIASSEQSSSVGLMRDEAAFPRHPQLSAEYYSAIRDLPKPDIDAPETELSFLRAAGAGQSVYSENVDAVVVIFSDGGRGSGAVIHPEGLVITNWHVIQGSDSVGIKLRSRERGLRFQTGHVGDVVAVNVEKDLALVRFRAPPKELKSVKLGSLTSVEIGMRVHAIGHPDGQEWTYTAGVVSQIRRDHQWQYAEDEYHSATVIQTQTPINPGNSGGPLFSDSGELIGINSFSRPDSEGLNFAVAVDELDTVLRNSGTPVTESKRALPEPLSRYADPAYIYDVSGDGKADAYGFDTDNNGYPDLWAFDGNYDDKADVWQMDANENDVPDAEIELLSKYEPGRQGYVWFIDVNEDGTYELQGYDFNSDGEIDQLQPL